MRAIEEGYDRFRRWLGLPEDEDTKEGEPDPDDNAGQSKRCWMTATSI